jgi:flagellar motility protein MotE (MotC chaperone)
MQETERRYSGMEWVFYIIILPMLFTALLVGIILQFLGYDITGKIGHAARSLPVINKIMPADPNEVAADNAAVDPAKQLQDAQDQVQSLENSKKQLEDDLVKKDSEIEKLKKQIEDLKKKPDAQKDDSATAATDPYVQQAQVYSQMNASKAAVIMAQLSVTEAKRIMAKMTNDQKAAILEKMDPAIASKILSS